MCIAFLYNQTLSMISTYMSLEGIPGPEKYIYLIDLHLIDYIYMKLQSIPSPDILFKIYELLTDEIEVCFWT